MNPSRKMTSDKQIVSERSLAGNVCISVKSWSCIAFEKSNGKEIFMRFPLCYGCLDQLNTEGQILEFWAFTGQFMNNWDLN